jgi:thiamine-phosphate pyrophosphorylase
MKLIVISSPVNSLYHELETIVQLFNYGLTFFHLRKPNFTQQEYEEFIIKIPGEHRNKIIIHNYHDLAIKYNLKGIHFSSYTQPSNINTNFPIQKSKSCHSLREIKEIKGLYNYVFLSPIFDSISKPSYQANFNQQELNNFLINRNELPEIIALGGIEINKLEKVKHLGFAGVAVLGTIWQEETLEKRLNKFNELQAKLLFKKMVS